MTGGQVLLPQPGGFEGLGAVNEALDALDLAADEVVDVPGARILAAISG